VEPEELVGTVGMVVVVVAAAGLVVQVAWVAWVEEQEGLDCHNRCCLNKQ
jgi:hypothetical protein